MGGMSLKLNELKEQFSCYETLSSSGYSCL